MVNNKQDYEMFNNVSLDELKDIIHGATLNALTESYGILSLGDLFTKVDNGVLKQNVLKVLGKSIEQKELYYKKILAIVNILKCKYLNEKPLINENTTIDEFQIKLGLTKNDIDKLVELGIKDFSQLLEMAKNDDYSMIYSIPNWGKTKADKLVNKIKIIYNYLNDTKEKKGNNIDEERIENKQNDNLSMDKIILLHNELKRLNEGNRRLTLEINKVTEQINEKKQNSNSATNIDYLTLKNTSLLEVENFFSKQNFHFLISNGFVSLWDIFNKDFYNEMLNGYQHYPYNERKKIISTVKILRCKYLGDDPFVREVTSYKVFEEKLGISLNTVLFLHYNLGINNVANLLNLLEDNQLIELYYNQIDSTLVHKLLVIEKFLKSRQSNHWQKTNLQSSVVTKIGSNSFVIEASLLEQLKKLIKDNNGIIRQIELTQNDLEKELEKVKVIKR